MGSKGADTLVARLYWEQILRLIRHDETFRQGEVILIALGLTHALDPAAPALQPCCASSDARGVPRGRPPQASCTWQ